MRCLMISLLALTLISIAAGQNSQQSRGAPEYKVARRYRTVKSETLEVPPTLVLQISLSPSAFNREMMIALANRLRRDLPKEKRIEAIFFTDYQRAKIFTAKTDEQLASIRGNYYLDRSSHEERISFAPDPSNPDRVVRIDLARQ